MEDYNQIYPNIPQSGDNFRLQKTYDALGSLEKEVKHYENVRKKYKRVQSTFSKLSMSTGFLSVILGSSGLGTSLSGFGLVVGVPLGALAGVFGLTSVGCAAVSKRLSQKVSKHDQTVAVARSKVNSIRDLVSKALKDNKISDEEFSLILSEVDKFEELKFQIRQKSRKEEEKNINMTKLRETVREEILKDLTKGANRPAR